jgi:hypothetical protein
MRASMGGRGTIMPGAFGTYVFQHAYGGSWSLFHLLLPDGFEGGFVEMIKYYYHHRITKIPEPPSGTQNCNVSSSGAME